jgi:hypothetical protein
MIEALIKTLSKTMDNAMPIDLISSKLFSFLWGLGSQKIVCRG